jgi:hypothetical protein
MSFNNVLKNSTTNGSSDEEDESNKSTKAIRKKSMSMNDNEIRNKIIIRKIKRRSNSCIFRRKDFYGNIISKGNKNYKVTFRDMVTINPLSEVIPVLKFRYSDEKFESNVGRVELARCDCKCIII